MRSRRGTRAAQAQRYRGADRRRALSGAPGATVVALEHPGARITLLLAALLIGAAGATAPPAALALLGLAITIGANVAAAVCLLHYRVATDAPATFLGISLALISVAVVGVSAVTIGLVGPDAVVRIRAVTLVAVAGAVVAMLQAARHADVDTALRPWRITVGLAALLILVMVGGTIVGLHLDATRIVVRLAAGGAFLTASLTLSRRFRDPATDPHRWAGAAAAWLAVAQILFAIAVVGGRSWQLAALLADLGAVVTAVAGSCDDLARAFRGHRDRLRTTLVDHRLDSARDDARQVLQRRRNHDLMSAVTAVGGASLTLERYADQLTPEDRDALRDAASRQLANLTEMLRSPTEVPELIPFPFLDTLRPVWRGAPDQVDVRPPDTGEDVTVCGRPDETVAVVRTVLGVCAGLPSVRWVDIELQPTEDEAVLAIRPDLDDPDATITPGGVDAEVLARLVGDQGGVFTVDGVRREFRLALQRVEGFRR